MAEEYAMLSKSQTDWMCKVFKHMVQLTAYYSFSKKSLQDEDCEKIIEIFSNYTKKSRDNKMVIKCGNALIEYLDKSQKGENKAHTLDRDKLHMLETVVEELFDMTAPENRDDLKKLSQEELEERIGACGEGIGESELIAEIKSIFIGYAAFCTGIDTALSQNRAFGNDSLCQNRQCAKGR